MSIEKMLVVSTAHLDANTADLLNQGVHFGIDNVWGREFGWAIFPHNIWSAEREGNPVPKCLRDLAEVATMQGCTLILLDSDGEELGNLQTWDW